MPVDPSLVSAIQPASALAPARTEQLAARRVRMDVAQEFEAFVIQSFIQEMLPKESSGVFGRGIAGDIWRSMLSEKLAYEVAERGSLGIAEQIRDAQKLSASQSAMAPTAAPLSTDERRLGELLGIEGR